VVDEQRMCKGWVSQFGDWRTR